jgi:hypothetical protein
MKLILIHGRAQQGKDPVVLQRTWEDAFEEGLRNAGLARPPGVTVEFPYYGDTLDDLVRQLDTPLVADVIKRGAKQDDAEASFRGEFLEEVARSAGLTDQDIQAFLEGDVQERGPQNWKWVHAILKALDHSRVLGDFAIDSFTRDVYLYLTNRAVHRRIDAIVAAALPDEPCVVVGHSLGSVIGYNVLRSARAPIVRYVTVGSPLAIRAVKNRLPTVEMPRTTRCWFNARDKDDVVALYPLNAQTFATTPPIEHYDEVDNQTGNQHGIIGYLPNARVARAIHEALDS